MCVYFLKLKSEMFNEFQKFKGLVEKSQVVTLPLLGFITVENFVPKNSIVFVLNMGSKDSSLHPILHRKMKWLRDVTAP